MSYDFDRFLRYDELVAWLRSVADANPGLVTLDKYGSSHEGRDLMLVTITDTATGAHDTKPAHWVDASIHAVELTATVAACVLIDRLVTGWVAGDPLVIRALQSRTFYVAPRVNPDGAEWVLADRPKFRRSSTRAWPWTDGHQWPGLHSEDIDGDGRVLQMRIADPNGGWMPHPDDARLLIPVPPHGTTDGTARYRLLTEGVVVDHDGFTVPTPRRVESLDLNRNFPAGWGPTVYGSGDHPLSEPEIDALVRAISARPNVCGYNAYHTSGGVLLRGSSTRGDAALDPLDLWVWKHLGATGTDLTGYPSHSAYEDFTFDKSETMSGAADDWTFDHLGIFGWTTEFWDIVQQATGTKQSTHFWYTGPTDAEALAVLRWCDANHPAGYSEWRPFDHPTLGPIEIGGWDELSTFTNPPTHLLRAEVAPHAEFAIQQALSSPKLEIPHTAVVAVAPDTWRVEAGVANTGWLPTDISRLARKNNLVKPITVEISSTDPIEILDGPARRKFGQLEGRVALRFAGANDGTPDRLLATWLINAKKGTTVTITAIHDRSGRISVSCTM